MDEPRLSRRRLLTAGAVIGAVPVATAAAAAALGGRDVPFTEGRANAPAAVENTSGWTWFTEAEAAFVSAAVGRLIPADDLGPGAVEAGVPVFIDRQLAGPYGRGERWYMQGPWGPGVATQGWQTRLTPAGMYRAVPSALYSTLRQSGYLRFRMPSSHIGSEAMLIWMKYPA